MPPEIVYHPREVEHYDVMQGSDRHEVKVADHGFVALVDVMPRLVPVGQTADMAVVQAARVSIGAGTKTPEEDRNLIRYMMSGAYQGRCPHSSPFEMIEFKFHFAMPIFVARQFIRHRTACLTGDTLLQFDLPGGIERRGNQLYSLSVKDVYDRFQPTANDVGHYKRDRVQGMLLRCVDESTGVVTHTRVVDVWESGEKDVWAVTYNGKTVTCSADHMFLTGNGWRRLGEVATLNSASCHPSHMNGGERLSWIGPGVGTAVPREFNRVEVETESWRPAPGDWSAYYEVSDQGRVRRLAGGRGSSRGRCKTPTVSQGRAVVNLNRPGVQETWPVHQLVALAFLGPCPEGMEVCHEDGNSLNNDLDNLRYGTKQSNADDRVRDGATTALQRNYVTPKIEYAGKQMTYDLEVAGPWHNFSAGGFVVHNSVNEFSARYSVMKDRFFRPEADAIRQQSKNNRQGGTEVVDDVQTASDFLAYLDKAEALYADYLEAEKRGIAREMARVGLPLSIYTEWIWKCDAHNIMHFLNLRMDHHAQKEIRDYADAMFALIKPVIPGVAQAFLDYKYDAVTLSALEVAAVREKLPLASENKRELAAWADKKKKLGLEHLP
jgi:thymidylate synthase ThyX